VVQALPPVEVMRTVVAVTAPVLAICPKALTQSPTAKEDAVVGWVCDKVVEVDSVTFKAFDFGRAGFVVFLVVLDGRVNEPTRIPVRLTSDPLIAVTFPEAMDRLAPENARRNPEPPLDPLGRPLAPASPPAPPNPPRAPPPNPPNALRPVVPLLEPEAHAPEVDAALMDTVLAAMVVLDDFDGVPVTVRQSPTATPLWVCVTVSENVVVPVQFTVD
jgi:hypothetical protein